MYITKRSLILTFCLLAGVCSCCNRQKQERSYKEHFSLYKVDALTKILPQTTEFKEITGPVQVARGENATIELVVSARTKLSDLRVIVNTITNKKYSLDDVYVGRVLNVGSEHQYQPAAPDKLVSPNGLYPDPVINDEEYVEVEANDFLTYFIDIPIPTTAKSGIYRCSLSVNCKVDGQTINGETDFEIEVFPVTIEKQSLTVTNWLQGDPFDNLNRGEEVEDDSELYWELRKELIEFASRYGNNAFRLEFDKVGISASEDGNDYVLDFTRFDKGVELYLSSAKDIAQIHGLHFGGRGDWVDPFEFRVYDIVDGEIVFLELPHTDPRVKQHIDRFFPKLQEHLRSKKLEDGRTWLDIFAQFIADEPIDENLDGWEAVAKMIKQAAPDIRIIEAYRATRFNPDLIDIAVPQLDELTYPVYASVPEGTEVWMYSCMYPRGNYANRFVELSSLKNRLLHWLNYKFNTTGYLHWGLEYWDGLEDPYKEVSSIENDWPGGDALLAYPGYRKLYPSLRIFNMRDGIRDFELLKMVEEKDSNKAKEFLGKVVFTIDSYNTDIDNFRQVRSEMLKYLSMN